MYTQTYKSPTFLNLELLDHSWKKALSNAPSKLRPKAAIQKTNNFGNISGGTRERKLRSHVQKIASILTKKRTGEASESRTIPR